MIHIKLTKKGWIALFIGLFAALIFIIFAYFLGLLALILGTLTMLINMIWGVLIWIATQLGLTALIGWVTTQITALFAWFATTWLGSLIMPLYTWITPLMAKFGPAVTMGKWSRKLWQRFTSLRKKGRQQLKNTEIIIEHEDNPDKP